VSDVVIAVGVMLLVTVFATVLAVIHGAHGCGRNYSKCYDYC